MIQNRSQPTRSIFKSRLAKRHLCLVLAFSSLITLIGTMFQLFFEYRSDIKYIDTQMGLVESSYIESLTNSLWTLDDKQIAIQMNNMLSLRDIVYLEITERGQVIYATDSTAAESDAKRSFPMIYRHQGTAKTIGVLHVYASYSDVYNRMLRRIVVILSTQGLKTFFVSLFILFILHRQVIRYIVKISDYAKGLQIKGLDKNLDIDRRRSSESDELDTLIDAINAMRIRLRDDIHRRKKTEDSLLRYEHIISSTNDLMSFVDAKYRYQAVNDAYLIAHDISRDDIVGASVPDIMGRDKFDRVVKGYLDRALSGKSIQYQSWFDYAGFGRRYMDVTYHPFKNHEGEISGVVVSVHDMTQRKQIENALQLSLEKFEKTFQTAPIWVVLSTIEDGRYIEVNDTILSTTGYQREELIGNTSIELKTWVDPLDRDRVVNKIKKDGSVRNIEVQRRTKSGKIIDTLFSAATIQLEGKDIMISVTQDITEQKSAESERLQLQTQLLQAQKIESVGRLAGGIAHDLNNLLSPILGYGEMLIMDTSEADPRRDSLAEIVNAAMRARDLVQQLLAFSRKQTLEFNSIDVNTMILKFEKLLRRTIREDISIHILLEPELSPILGDMGQLEQVIMNLSVNAQDAMPDGGELTIETALVELDEAYAREHESVVPGAYILLTVSDTGCGMEPKTLEKMFEPFFTTKVNGQGTGLGLATVYGIVKQHNGSIWAYSEPHQGTTFKIYLPICSQPARHHESPGQSSSEINGSEHILLVEDNEQVRTLAHKLLERTGYTVLTAKNGPEALTMLERYEGHLHLLLTDVVMPEMNGKQLFKRVSSHYPEVKVLYMSGYTENVITQRGVIEAGINFLPKPFSIDSLSAKVREVLDGQS